MHTITHQQPTSLERNPADHTTSRKTTYDSSKMSLTQINAAAAKRDYNITPRVDYRTVLDVEGPLVILDNVKFPK